MAGHLTHLHVPLSTEALHVIWQGLNVSYFQNRLPPIEIQWSARLTSSAGLFVSQTGPRDARLPGRHGQTGVLPAGRHGPGRVIRLSIPLLCDQSLLFVRDTLAHEMIHQWQFDVKKCRPSHGREFRRLMDVMNADGLNVSIYHTMTEAVEGFAKFTWRCVRCGYVYHRQRNTLSTRRHRCGQCLGALQEIGDSHVRAPRKSPRPRSLQAVCPVQLSLGF